jgi:tetratricopeptide (TPR) repeat protein
MSGWKFINSALFRGLFFLLVIGALAAIADRNGYAANAPIHTDPLNYDPVVKDGYQHIYNLEYDAALARFEQVQAAHPNEPIATTYVLNCVLFRELYRLDLLDTTFYANDGFLSGRHTVLEDPKVREQVYSLADKAIMLADEQLQANPDNLNALFARGWARSLKATYVAMVERGFTSSLHLAIQARSDHEHVLEKDPNYVDAKMVVGVYQYVVGSLAFGFKILVGFVGMGGSKTKGLELLRDAAARGVITSVESRTCIAFFLRREAQYKEAITIVRSQAKEYPRDFLFAQEEANLLKDDGQAQAAIAAYRRLLDEAKSTGRYPNAHLELAYFGLGDTLRGQNMFAEAVAAFQQAAAQSTVSPELKRRCLLAAGQVYDLMHDHDKARGQYLAVVAAGPDTTQAEQARKYMRTAYTR